MALQRINDPQTTILNYPFLPETYFPKQKRGLLQRPVDPRVVEKVLKKPRLGDSPQEHKDVAEICKIDRNLHEAGKKCTNPVQSSLINGHVRMMRVLETQNKTLRQTHEMISDIGHQMSSLAAIAKSLRSSSSSISTADRKGGESAASSKASPVDPEALTTYSKVLQQTREAFERNVKDERKVPSSSALVRFGTQQESQASASSAQEILKNVRELLLNVFKFDCLPEHLMPKNRQNGSTKISVNSWQEAVDVIKKMEEQFTLFKVKHLRSSDSKKSGIKSGKNPGRLPGAKRKFVEESINKGDSEVVRCRRDEGGKKMLVPRRVGFVFPDETMDVD